MTGKITWLHLSDLHACRPNSGWDAKRVLDALLADLQRLNHEQGLQPNLIFFTGDAAFGHLGNVPGKAIGDQFREAHDFLTAVRKAFPNEIAQRNVFLVPGNHDVNQSRITRFQTKWLQEQRQLEELEQIIRDAGAEWQQLLERLHDYKHALEVYGYEHLLTGRERLIYSDMREVAGLSPAYSPGFYDRGRTIA